MMQRNNPYSPIKSDVIEVIEETPTIKTIRLQPEVQIEFKTGQFIELTVPGIGEAPFTPSSNPHKKEIIEVTVMKVGKVTDAIHRLRKGDIVGIRGPFGKGYPFEEFKGKEILVVGGGCGFAPLRSLMYEFFEHSGDFKALHFRGGCKTPEEFLYRSEIEGWQNRNDIDVVLTVDKGNGEWKGRVGLVTTILDGLKIDLKNAIAVICGPPIMMKFTTLKVIQMGFKEDQIYLSMERNMSCGIGKCGHCRLGKYYVCKDGPVFRYDLVKDYPDVWD